jgi:hypothetical protein
MLKEKGGHFFAAQSERGRIQDFKLGERILKKMRKYLGYFVWKITILRQKILFFPNLGGARRVGPSPESAVAIITNIVNPNPVHGEVYSILYHVIKFVSDLRQLGGFLRVLRFPPQIKLTATI